MHYCFHSSLGFLSGKLSRLSSQMLERRFKRTEVPISIEQWRVLAMLSEYDGASISTIADALFLSLAPVSRQVKSLITLNLVQVRPGEQNHKQKRVFLTPKGRIMAQRCCEHGYDVIASMLDNLSEEETNTLLSLLQHCIANAERDGQYPDEGDTGTENS